MKKGWIFPTVISLVLALVTSPVLAGNLTAATGYLEKNAGTGFTGMLDWPILALAGMDRDVSALLKERERGVKNGLMFNPERSTDYQRTVFAVAAAGGDARSFGGYDLIEAIKKSQRANGKFADKISGQGDNLVNAHIWGIISLYGAGEQIPNEAGALSWLVDQQNSDGGYSIDTSIKSSDIDMTGMALLAFGALGQDGRHPAVQRALEYLQKNQGPDGGFVSWGGSSVESISQVIQGLVMLGIDPKGGEWTTGSGDPLTALAAYQLKDGSFSQRPGGKGDVMATYQAVLALGDYQRGQSIYRHLRQQNLRFPDLSPSHYAASAARKLVAKGILAGYPDGSFRPNNLVKRQEFAPLLTAVAGLDEHVGPKTTAFRDVPAGHWANPHIRLVAGRELMIGKSAGEFAPEASISGGEVAAILVRLLTGKRDLAAGRGEPWYAGFVRKATAEGLLYPNFDPLKPATRAQCVYSLGKLTSLMDQ